MALPTPLGVGRCAVILFQEWALTSVGSLFPCRAGPLLSARIRLIKQLRTRRRGKVLGRGFCRRTVVDNKHVLGKMINHGV